MHFTVYTAFLSDVKQLYDPAYTHLLSITFLFLEYLVQSWTVFAVLGAVYN